MSVLQTLKGQWDFLTGRFNAYRVETPAQRAECEAVLRRVRGEELNRQLGDDPWASPAFGGRDIPTHVYAVRDRRSGEVVGVLQEADASTLMDLPGTVHAYALDRIAPELLPRTSAAIFFAILPAWRKTPAGIALLAVSGRLGVQRGIRLAVCIAEPAILRRYVALGARPLAPMRSSGYGGWRVPLFLNFADRRHLEAVGSPFRFALKASDTVEDPEVMAWQAAFLAEHGEIDTGVMAWAEETEEEAPAYGLLSRGMDEAGVAALLDGSLVLRANPGDRILAAGDGGKLIGVVLSGAVHVVVRDRVVAVLGRGEPFGEIAFSTGMARTADLVAASDGTRLLQFSPAALERLPPAPRAALWQNISWCLAQRLAHTTARLSP